MIRGVVAVLAASAILVSPMQAEPAPVKITGYCLRGTMANGEETRPGVCAYKKADIGKVARVYDSNMVLIGEYEIADTGKGGIRKGTVVDIWKETRAECYALTQYGFIEVVEREGRQWQ